MSAGWEHFEVEADVGVRGWGRSRGEAFAQATLGVFALIVAPGDVQVREHREVRAQAEAPEALLVAWIDESLYVHEIEGFVVGAVELTTCTDTLAQGVLGGEPLDAERHRVGTVVKGATYHLVSVRARESGWEVTIIIDV
ncbi:MAG TPA: archease [Methylomirabilota bacterium]|nr:archease [Methylomirabilota bacterium]